MGKSRFSVTALLLAHYTTPPRSGLYLATPVRPLLRHPGPASTMPPRSPPSTTPTRPSLCHATSDCVPISPSLGFASRCSTGLPADIVDPEHRWTCDLCLCKYMGLSFPTASLDSHPVKPAFNTDRWCWTGETTLRSPVPMQLAT